MTDHLLIHTWMSADAGDGEHSRGLSDIMLRPGDPEHSEPNDSSALRNFLSVSNLKDL